MDSGQQHHQRLRQQRRLQWLLAQRFVLCLLCRASHLLGLHRHQRRSGRERRYEFQRRVQQRDEFGRRGAGGGGGTTNGCSPYDSSCAYCQNHPTSSVCPPPTLSTTGTTLDFVAFGAPQPVACAPAPGEEGTDLCTGPGGQVTQGTRTGPSPSPSQDTQAGLPTISGGSGEIPYYNLSEEAELRLTQYNLTVADVDQVLKNGQPFDDLESDGNTNYVLNRQAGQNSLQVVLSKEGTLITVIVDNTPFSLSPPRFIPISTPGGPN